MYQTLSEECRIWKGLAFRSNLQSKRGSLRSVGISAGLIHLYPRKRRSSSSQAFVSISWRDEEQVQRSAHTPHHPDHLSVLENDNCNKIYNFVSVPLHCTEGNCQALRLGMDLSIVFSSLRGSWQIEVLTVLFAEKLHVCSIAFIYSWKHFGRSWRRSSYLLL